MSATATVMIQWRCKGPHRDCGARSWRQYKVTSLTDASEFMAQHAPHSMFFNYRVVPAPRERLLATPPGGAP